MAPPQVKNPLPRTTAVRWLTVGPGPSPALESSTSHDHMRELRGLMSAQAPPGWLRESLVGWHRSGVLFVGLSPFRAPNTVSPVATFCRRTNRTRQGESANATVEIPSPSFGLGTFMRNVSVLKLPVALAMLFLTCSGILA